MPAQPYEPVANHALAVFPDLDVQGIESSKVFALTALYLSSPPPGFPSMAYLEKHLASLYLFIIHPSPRKSNPNPSKEPVVFFINITRNKVEVGRGRPPMPKSTMFSRKTRKVTVLECSDRDFVDIATGKARYQHLMDTNKIRFKGKLDYFEKIMDVIHHQRSQLYNAVVTEPQKRASASSELESSDDSLDTSYAVAFHARL